KVFFGFFKKAVAQVSARNVFAFFSKKWRIVDRKQHAHRRFVNGDRSETFRVFKIGDGIANIKEIDSTDRTEVAATDFLHFFFAHYGISVLYIYSCFQYRTISLQQRNRLVGYDLTS